MKKMNRKKAVYILVGLLVILGGLYMTTQETSQTNATSYRALPRPMAKEPVLITSAGQNTDSYIIKDIINKLMIDNYFIPMASKEHLEEIRSAIMVVGYSDVGIRLKDKTFIDEKQRVEQVIKSIEEEDIFLITIYLRGEKMLTEETKILLEHSAKASDYVIVVNSEAQIEEIKAMLPPATPITFVDELSEISEPIVSAFR